MLLSELAKQNGGQPPNEVRSQLDGITQKARQVATAMDEIVWTVNPKNDSLPDLASYLCDYAHEFLRAAKINCRIDMMEGLPSMPVTAQQRHNLFLAVKEGLNNAVKHSGAGEVWLRISLAENWLRVVVEDNGRGFDPGSARSAGNGLQNMRSRLETIQGRLEFSTGPSGGTTLCFSFHMGVSSLVPGGETLN
jgi:signal transduction histidine kinase